jgi:hypothetical protein
MKQAPRPRTARGTGPTGARIWLLASLFCALLSLSALARKVLFLHAAHSAQGTIVRLVQSGVPENTGRGPVARFVVADKGTFTTRPAWVTDWNAHRVGDTVRVLYDPDNPGKAVVDDFTEKWGTPLVWFLIAVMSAIVYHASNRQGGPSRSD